MKQTIVKFTDSFGVQHDAAVFELSYGYKNINQTETIGSSQSSQRLVSISFQFKYWHSDEAKVIGFQPMQLTEIDGQGTFGAYPTSDDDIVDLEQFCIDQLINVVLPSIDPNFVVLSQTS